MPGYECFDHEEKKQIDEVMSTGVLMRYGFDTQRKGNWKAKELENKICETFQCNYAQLTSSGTAALNTAMVALGIGYGDEVIMPAFTFVASFEAIISVGAIPVLVDIDESLTLDPVAVKAAITSKTKCIMPVHMCGSMADMDALKSICAQHNIFLLEDACQSIGGTYKGKHLGTIGDAGTFSFDYVKTITCGEGGVVLTNSETVYNKCDAYTDHGHDHKGVDRGADLHPYVGYNYRISELHAAIGVAQIGKLKSFLAIQRKNHAILKSLLSTIPELTFRKIHDEEGDSCTFLSWFLPDSASASQVVAEMKSQNILAGNFYWFENNWHYIRKWDHLTSNRFLNNQSEELSRQLQQYSNKPFVASDAIMSRCISTAISLTWTEEQIKDKAEKILAVLKKILKDKN
jgi:8-amino-3,8-dideoxy-alpha-D-manno-octulosonate transaminase